MSSAKKIAKNTGFLFIAEVVDKSLLFLFIIILTNYLGDTKFGIYSFAFAFVGIFSMLSNLEMNTFMVREIARDKSKTNMFVNNIITLKFLLSLFVFTFVLLIISFLNRFSALTIIIALVMVHEILTEILLTITAMFNAHEKMQYTLFAKIIEKIFSVSLSFFILYMGYELKMLISILILSKLLTLGYCYLVSIRKFIKIMPSFNLKFCTYTVRTSLPFWFNLIFYRLYTRTDTIMLSMLKGFAVTGWYNAASKLIEALSFFPNIIINSVFPVMSRYHQSSKILLKVLFEKTFYYLFVLGFPLTLSITLLADRFILFIYNDQFIKSAIILRVLAWSVLFIFINSSLGYLLNAINKQAYFTASNGVCALVNVILNLILIPKYSYLGAAIATVITQILNFSLLYAFTAKSGYKLNLIKTTYKPVISGILMVFTISYLKSLHLLIIVPVSILIYFFFLLLTKGIGREEWQIVKSFFPKKS